MEMETLIESTSEIINLSHDVVVLSKNEEESEENPDSDINTSSESSDCKYNDVPFHQLQNQLVFKLNHRPEPKELFQNNIIHQEMQHVAPSLQATVRFLDFQRRLNDVDHKFAQRPQHHQLIDMYIIKTNHLCVAPCIQATQQLLIFRQLQDGLHHKLERRPEPDTLMKSNILPRHDLHRLATPLLPVIQSMSFKLSKCQMEAKMGVRSQNRELYLFDGH